MTPFIPAPVSFILFWVGFIGHTIAQNTIIPDQHALLWLIPWMLFCFLLGFFTKELPELGEIKCWIGLHDYRYWINPFILPGPPKDTKGMCDRCEKYWY